MILKMKNGFVLASGTATKDAECKRVGEKQTVLTSFSIAAGKREDTTTIFVNCKAWRRLGEYASCIRKGDAVLCVGQIDTHEYNGKTYNDLVCEYVGHTGASFGAVPPAAPPPEAASAPAFSDLDGDDTDLPF